MAIRPNGTAHRQLRTLFHVGTTGDLTDGQLLERFATGRGEASELAFAALVERHGRLVLGACRAVLRDEHDAQDAFQATFLVLVRKAPSLWVRDSLGPWLHAVAHRAARCALAARERRRLVERDHEGPEPARDVVEGHRADLAEVLHAEVDRLPGRYRAPVVLCDLEGLTHEQAARHLGCPVGTVKSRLSRARRLLRDRLTRRGLAPRAGLGAMPAATVARVAVPPGLVRSTVGLAIRSATGAAGASIPAAVALLTQGVSTAMLHASLSPLAIPVFALALAAGAAITPGGGGRAPTSPEPPRGSPMVSQQEDGDPGFGAGLLYEVRAGGRPVTVTALGVLETPVVIEVPSPVDVRTTILSILPEGTRVVKGQLVCELDAAPLHDRLANQQIANERAQADYLNAVKTLEVAEANVREYLEVTYPQEVKTIEGEIKLAELELERAKGKLSWSDKMLKLGYLSQAQNVSDKYDAQRASFNLEQAQKKLEVLRVYTKAKTEKKLEADVEEARGLMLSRRDAWEHEQAKGRDLREQIDRCKIVAPEAGAVVYPSRMREGAEVQGRERLFTILGLDTLMRANVQVPEAPVHRVVPGQRARVRFFASPDVSYDGKVIEVAPTLDSYVFRRLGQKIYPTLIEMEALPTSLGPGMTLEARILISDADEITVPTRAVLHHDGKAYVAVRRPGGGFEWRSVGLGLADKAYVEVVDGLRPGDLVALDPIAVLRREDEAGVPPSPADPGLEGR